MPRPRLRTVLSAITLLIVATALPRPGHAVGVEAWSATWRPDGQTVFLSDDFEDGVFPGAPLYAEECGVVQPGDEADGQLEIGLRGEVQPTCPVGEQALGFNASVGGPLEIRATFVFELLPEGAFFGFSAVKGLGGAEALEDNLTLLTLRAEIPFFGDSVLIGLVDEDFDPLVGNIVQFSVLDIPTASGREGQLFELALDLELDGDLLRPQGRFRFGDEPFVDLVDLPGSPEGVLAAGDSHAVGLVAIEVPEPRVTLLLAFAMAALVWRTRQVRGPTRAPRWSWPCAIGAGKREEAGK